MDPHSIATHGSSIHVYEYYDSTSTGNDLWRHYSEYGIRYQFYASTRRRWTRLDGGSEALQFDTGHNAP